MQATFQKHTDNAVSKTVNLPNHATREDVDKIFTMAYELGCKGVTVYRDGSRANQVLVETNTGAESDKEMHAVTEQSAPTTTERPDNLRGSTHKIQTGLGNLYVTVNELDGKPFEVFATIGKSGKSTMAKTEAIGRLVSLALRNHIPVKHIVKQLKGISGEKPLMTKDGMVWSVPDAVGSLLEKLYVARENMLVSYQNEEGEFIPMSLMKEECPDCGASLVHEEGCLKCARCGYSKC
jgi:ribonucleoside-diphosphate reductase alpha chain